VAVTVCVPVNPLNDPVKLRKVIVSLNVPNSLRVVLSAYVTSISPFN